MKKIAKNPAKLGVLLDKHKGCCSSVHQSRIKACICESLTNTNKFKLLETDDEMSGKELLTFISNVLTKELPLEIPGPDSQRVGDFEIFNFAYESSNDVAPLESSIIKDDENGQLKGDAVEISIKPNRFKGKVYLRCRTRNGNVIIGDQLRLIENGNINQNVIFENFKFKLATLFFSVLPTNLTYFITRQCLIKS